MPKPFILRSALAMGASVLAIGLAGSPAIAQNLFDATVTAGGRSDTRGVRTFDEFIDILSQDIDYSTINPSYSDTAPAVVDGNLRGLDLRMTFPTGGTELLFTIPSLGVSLTFDSGISRNATDDLLVDFLESNQDGLLTRIFQELVATTATDPVAGNPASLQSRMASSDFAAGTGTLDAEGNSTTEEKDGRGTLVGLGARLGRFTAQGFDQTVIELPFSYTIPLADPRYGIVLDAPLTYVETANTDTYALSLGVGFRIPIFDNWVVTPAVRAGATGSIDVGSAAVLYSGSVTSSFKWSGAGLNWELGNMVGYSTTGSTINSDGYSVDYDLENTIFRNGITVSRPTRGRIFGSDTTWEASVVNTQIEGDAVFVDNYTDIAFSYGTQSSRNGLTWDSLRIGVTYTFSDADYEGVRINFGYKF